MANLIPQCPKCHGTVTLAPIPASVIVAEIKCADLLVSCMECHWVGRWAEVIYTNV